MIHPTLVESRTVKGGVEYVYWRAQWYENGEQRSVSIARANGPDGISRREAKKLMPAKVAEAVKDGNLSTATLAGLEAMYFRLRPDMNERTAALYRQTFKRLRDTFGDGKLIASIGKADAKEWEASMRLTLSPAATRLHIRNAKALFGSSSTGAIGLELIDANPFVLLKSGSVAGTKSHVSEADAEKVRLELSPAHRVPFVLARYCGLRTPSETATLTWNRIVFDKLRIVVIDRKRSRVEDDRPEFQVRERVVLRAPRAEPDLLAAGERRDRDDSPVVTVNQDPKHLHRAIQAATLRAGLPTWPKTLQTLRQSAENDWRSRYPVHVVEEWMGHADSVGRRNYASVDERWYVSNPEQRGNHSENGAGKEKGKASEPASDSPATT